MSDRTTFESAAGSYHQARPEFPDELYDQLTDLAELSAGGPLLEIGCGTGKATLALAPCCTSPASVITARNARSPGRSAPPGRAR